MAKKVVVRLLASIVAAAILSGCGSNLDNPDHPVTKDEIGHAEAKMRQLPSVEATERQLIAIIHQIADAAKTIAPELDWRIDVNRGQDTLGCPSPYLETDGVSMSTDRLVSLVPIADSEWPSVLNAARDIAAQNGITSLTIRVDKPGDHDVILHSPDNGNEIKLGTYKAALIGGSTGCRYREEDLRKQPGN
ncbi:LppA family lipoprotein [Nocardia amamiensis]|uniref:LppA family lipoprotein n=1 Tax=Nocardia amamiensis TaxID=404578 RepID=UPI00082F35F8|nr:LppA family lipoprotein [Nocardia amamiensis]